MSQTNKIVVGGGIAGLLSCILLKKNNPEQAVYLIEAQPDCGGLLRSIKTPEGYEFDYGTHILCQTGIAELDAIILERMDEQQWYTLPMLKPGNVFNGFFHKYSQLLYARALPQEDVEKGTYQLLSADVDKAAQAQNLAQYCQCIYGETFTRMIFAPLMEKLLGVGLDQLTTSAHKLFGYDRLITGPAAMMRELKKSPHFDQVLAFESYHEGVSALNNYYPKNGRGIGLWVDNLVAQAKALGVSVLTNTTISKIETQGKKISKIHTPNEVLCCDELIWTAPLFPLIKMTDQPFEPKYRPTIRAAALVHFVFDRDFLTHNFHVYCNEPQMKSFRLTLYSNIAENDETNGAYRCTVEILLDGDENTEDLEDIILQELVTMTVVSPEAKVLYSAKNIERNGFPVFTNQFVDELQRQGDCVKAGLENVTLLGKASANSFFMGDVLVEVFNQLSAPDESKPV